MIGEFQVEYNRLVYLRQFLLERKKQLQEQIEKTIKELEAIEYTIKIIDEKLSSMRPKP